MSDERRGEGGGAVAAVVIVVILGFIGLLVVGGIGTMFFMRSSQMAQMARVAEMEARMQAERARAEMMAAEAARAQLEATRDQATVEPRSASAPSNTPEKSAEPAGPVLTLEISAAGEYKLGEKNLSFEELKDALLAEHVDKGPNLVLAIAAQPETPFKLVDQAIEAAESASIRRLRIRNTPLEPAPNK